jgi:hypothetical protein
MLSSLYDSYKDNIDEPYKEELRQNIVNKNGFSNVGGGIITAEG